MGIAIGLGIGLPFGGAAAAAAGLSLDFTQGSLPAGASFSRASSAYDDNGSAVTAFATDQPRLSASGIRIEPAETTLVFRSTDLSASPWSGNGTFTVTQNAVAAPDGTVTATRFVSSGAAVWQQSVTVPADGAAQTLQIGCWLRARTGTCKARFAFTILAIAGYDSPDFTLTTTWQWVTWATIPSGVDGVSGAIVGLETAADASAVDLYAWGFKLSVVSDPAVFAAPSAFSTVASTGAAATRAADVLTFTVPTGIGKLLYTFDDDSTQEIAVASGAYTVPTSVNRRRIKTILGEAVSAAAALRQVATACAFPDFNYPAAYVNSRSRHVAAEALTSIKIAVANWYVGDDSGLTETSPSYDLNVTASIEYPIGTFTQVKFSAVAAGVVPSGTTLFSDFTTVSIPQGATFWVRMYRYGTGTPANVPLNQYGGTSDHSTAGEGIFAGASSGDDTMSGVIDRAPDDLVRAPPAAIVGMSTRRSFALLGDSRMEGAQDTNASNSDVGEVARAVGQKGYAYINGGRGFDQFVTFIASNNLRRALFAYCTDVVVGYGINDIAMSRTTFQLFTDLQTVRGYFPGQPLYVYTLPPGNVSSTDGFTTLVNQTANRAVVQARFNDGLRAGLPGAVTWDLSDVLSSARNSGKWRVDAGTITADGTHEVTAGAVLLRDYLVPLLP